MIRCQNCVIGETVNRRVLMKNGDCHYVVICLRCRKRSFVSQEKYKHEFVDAITEKGRKLQREELNLARRMKREENQQVLF